MSSYESQVLSIFRTQVRVLLKCKMGFNILKNAEQVSDGFHTQSFNLFSK